MAINKNFVIKNGVQVATDLIVGDSDTKKVGIGTTIAGYTLHVGATNAGGRGGIGATDAVVTGVGTIKDLIVTGYSGFSSDVRVTGIVSAQSFGIGTTEVIDRGLRLSGIASLDAITINTIEQAIRVGPNSFTDLKVTGLSTFVGVATFLGGIDVDHQSGVSTFSAPVQFGLGPSAASANVKNFVATAATVGFGTSVFFRDNASIFMGDSSDFRFYHDNTNSFIDNMTGALFVRNSVDNDDNSSITFQAKSGENSIVMTNSADESNEVELYYDGAKKLQTTSGGVQITGIATLTNRLHVQAGVSTFDADVRFGIGATVGFGTSAFFKDDAAIFLGDDSDLKIHHDGSNSRIQDVGTGDLIIQGSADIKLQSASAENYIVANDTGSVDIFFDNSKKVETTSGGLKVTGITTLTDRLHVEAGISTFDADVRFGIGATVGFGTSAFFRDDAAIFMGNDSDLKIHHDGSNSRIQDVGTGDLILQGSADIKLQSASAENYIVANDTGSVEIYFDNSKKVETTSGGLNVTGITTFSDRINVVSGVSTFQDDAKLTFGAQTDLLIQHDGTDTEIYNKTGNLKIRSNDLDIQDYTNGHSMITADQDGSVDLYYDNYNALQTTPQGINVSGVTTSNRLNISGVSTFTSIGSNLIPDTDGSRNIGAAGSEWQDLHIDGTANIDTLVADTAKVSDLTNNRVVIVGTSGELEDDSNFTFDGSTLVVNGSIDLSTDIDVDGTANLDILDVDGTSNFADDVTLVAAGSSTILFDASGLDLTFQDNIRAKFGTGKDLAIFHDGIDSYLSHTGSGVFRIEGNGSNVIALRPKTGENSLNLNPDGAVDLYYDNSKKVETTSGGLNVTGITTISDRLQVTSGISTFYDTTQSTSATTGAVIINGGVGIAKNVNIGGNLTVTGTTTFNGGTITLGDADTDNVVFSADVDSNIIPDDDDSFDLGSSTKEWQDLFIDGTAHIDTLDVDESAFVTTTLTVGTGLTVHPHGSVAAAGIVTANGGLLVGSNSSAGVAATIATNGNAAFSGIVTVANISQHRIVIGGANGELIDDGNLSFNTSSNLLTVSGSIDLSTDIDVDGTANLDVVDVDGTANFADDVTLVASIGAGSSTVLFDSSAGTLTFQDNLKAQFGTGSDLKIYHDGIDSYITSATGDLKITDTSDDITLTAADDIRLRPQGGENGVDIIGNAEVILYHNNNARVTTTDDGVDIGGTGSIRVPNGTTGERNASPAAGDFRYNTTNGEFEGYTDSWGAIAGSGGGATEVDTSVSTTSATSCGSFAIASFRSASIIAQITQGSNYQVGRYLVIHDGTTVTTIEESAVATGDMLGTFEGVINSSNLEFRVTMSSSSSATVTTKIDTVTV